MSRILKHFSNLQITYLNLLKNLNKHIRNNSTNRFSRMITRTFLISGSVLISAKYIKNRQVCNVHAVSPNVNDKLPQSRSPNVNDKLPLSRSHNYIADVVDKIGSAVVFIEVKGQHPFYKNLVTVSSGSGFIVESSGVILTNAHVVANTNIASVKLQDGRVLKGYVEFIDENSDLATIRVYEKNLPVIELGDSSKLRPGEWVIAMGSPFALSNTITVGVASSVNRPSHELGLHKQMEYIQTDAAINIGNSGGPLVNLDGQAIGINTMTATAGISFAIPSVYAIDFLKKAQQTRNKKSSWFGNFSEQPVPKRKRYIGITMITLSPNIISQFKIRDFDFPDLNKGVLVWKIVLGSPAHLGGLQAGDIITHVNGKIAESAKDVYKAVDSGKSVRLTIRRKAQTINIAIKPEDFD